MEREVFVEKRLNEMEENKIADIEMQYGTEVGCENEEEELQEVNEYVKRGLIQNER